MNSLRKYVAELIGTFVLVFFACGLVWGATVDAGASLVAGLMGVLLLVTVVCTILYYIMLEV